MMDDIWICTDKHIDVEEVAEAKREKGHKSDQRDNNKKERDKQHLK